MARILMKQNKDSNLPKKLLGGQCVFEITSGLHSSLDLGYFMRTVMLFFSFSFFKKGTYQKMRTIMFILLH
jgi:hypothetical protein